VVGETSGGALHKLAITGTGKGNRKTLLALFTDYYESVKSPRIVIPITSDEGLPWAVNILGVWAATGEVDYELVVPIDFNTKGKYPDGLLEGAASVTKTANVTAATARLLGPGDTLLVAWDDEDDTLPRALTIAIRNGAKALDLLDDLNPITLGDEDHEEGQEVTSEPEEDPVVIDPEVDPFAVWLELSTSREVIAQRFLELLDASVQYVAQKALEQVVVSLPPVSVESPPKARRSRAKATTEVTA
jgi:hypothetical protein